MANINAVITYNANLSPAQAQIKALTGQIGALSAAFNTLDKSAVSAQRNLAAAFASNVGQIGGFTTQTVKATTAVESFGRQLASNRLTMRQYFREAFAGYTKQNSMMKQLAIQQVRFQQSVAVSTAAGQAMMITPAQISAVSNSTAIASQKFSVFNELVDGGATKMLNWGKNTQWAGRQLMVGFTLPLALFTAAVSKQFRDLDKELTRFQKVYGQDLGNSVKNSTMAMRAQVEQLAFDIGKNYGIAAKDTAALAADIAATGAEGEKLLKSVQETTRLSVLGEVDRQEAMKATLALQSAFKMNTDELTESINFLNAVENQTSATLQDFSTAIPKVGPVVQSLGGDIEDLAMMLVAMREGGVPAAEAANAIKSGLASMINPAKKASEVAAEFGINLKKIVEDNKGQLMPTIYEMQRALQGLDDFGRARVIEEIFGKYQFARMSALFENLGRMGSQTEAVLKLTANSSVELASIANAELKTLQESTAMKFQRSLEQLRNTLIPIGETLTESLIPIFEFIGQASAKFIEFFQALPEPVKNFAKYGTAIAALAGPVIMLVGLFGNLIANGIKFGLMLTRIGAKIAGLKVEKFELLNADVMAAKLGVDNLTGSFTTQERALRQLTNAMAAYGSSLRTLQTTNPALFIPGAGKPPIKRAAGSSSPEFVPGSGRGDKIPAMLEPGEFIVNRKATEKYAPVLLQMNRGSLPGFVEGTQEYALSHATEPQFLNLRDPQTLSTLENKSTPYAWKIIQADMAKGAATLKTFSNLVFVLTKETNALLGSTGVQKSVLLKELESSKALEFITKKTGLTIEQLQPVMTDFRSRLANIDNELIDDPMMYDAMDKSLRKLTISSDRAAQVLQVLSQQYGAFELSSRSNSRRENFGIGVAPGYKGTLPKGNARIPLQSRPFTDLSPLFIQGISRGAASVTRSSSPSREAVAAGEATGRNIGNGAMNGLKRGLNQTTSGKGAGSPVAVGMSAASETEKESRLGTFSNVAFAATMAASSLTMMTGASGEAASKIGLFTTALMTATMATQMFAGQNVAGNFLGLGSLGGKLQAAGAARAAGSMGMGAPMAPLSMGVGKAVGAGAATKIPGGLAGAGSGLAQTGGMLSMLGGPVGIAAGLGITAAITGFMLYKNAAEEAEKRAVAAFVEPAKTAEFFGTTLTDTVQQMKDLQTTMEDTQDIDTGLRDAVKEDYSVLIEKLRFSGAEAGARELSLTFNKMIASGLSEESAVAAVEAIAVESGAAGGAAFAIAYKEGLLEAKTPEEVAQNLASAFDPELMEKNSKEIEKTINELRNPLMGFAGNIAESFDNGFGDAMTTLASFQSNINPQMWLLRAGINMAPEDHPVTQFFQGLVSGITDQDAMKASIDASSNYSRGMEQLYANLAENLDVSSTQLVSAVETLFGTFKDAPTETLEAFRQIEETALSMENVEFDPAPIQEFLTTLDPLTAITLNPLIQDNEELAYQIMEGVTAGMSLQEILQAIQNGSLDAEIDIKVNTQEAINKVNDLKTALSEALGEDLKTKLEASDQTIQDFDKNIGRVERSLERGTEKMQKDLDASQEASDAAIEALQEEVNAIQEKVDARREDSQEKIDDLNKEKDLIQESTDAYIKSIQKRQRVDSFYANQRKTAFSALQKLASGDVFGFLQARTEMGQGAQQFSYDNQIQAIEDRRDAETKAIDDTIEKEQEKQKQYEKNQQEKIDLLNDQIEAERKLQEQQRKGFEKDLEDFKKLKEERIKDLQDARDKETIKRQGIQKVQDVAANQQTISADELNKILGPKLAAPYIEQQKAILKSIYLAEIAKKDGTAQGALNIIRPLYDLLYGLNDDRGAVTNQQLLLFLRSVPTTETKAAGGYISGPGGPKSDVIPALLSNGEYVVKASSVSKYGQGMMDSINAGKFAEGGPVELKKSLDKWIPKNRLSYYSSWDQYGSWPGGKPSGIMMHHTAGVGPGVLEWMARNPDAGKPVVQAMVARDAKAHILAYGGTGWGAGEGSTDQLKDPKYSQLANDLNKLGGASSTLWQVEVESQGLKQDFSSQMFDTIARMSAAIKEFSGWNSFSGKIINHKDWAPGRKNDTLYPASVFEGNANGVLGNSGSTTQNGKGDGGTNNIAARIIPSSMSGGDRTVFGKAGPSYVVGRMFPGEGGGGNDGGNGGNNGGGSGGDISFNTPLPYGASIENARMVLSAVKSSWPENLWKAAWTIAMRESLGENLGPGHPQFNGSDYGIFQLNKPSYGSQSWWNDKKLLDRSYNARASYTGVSRSGASFLPWGMKIGKNGSSYSWDWSLYGGEPSYAKGWTIPATQAFWGSWRKKAAGGYISGGGGPRSDAIPAMLSNGEYVMKAGAVDKYGRGFMDQVNSGNLSMPSFGMPSSPSLSTSSIANSAYSNTMNSSNSSNNVKIVINGAGGKSATAIANKVASMINSSNDRRNHSRSM